MIYLILNHENRHKQCQMNYKNRNIDDDIKVKVFLRCNISEYERYTLV